MHCARLFGEVVLGFVGGFDGCMGCVVEIGCLWFGLVVDFRWLTCLGFVIVLVRFCVMWVLVLLLGVFLRVGVLIVFVLECLVVWLV